MKKKIIGLGIGIALAAAAIGVTGYAAASGTESLFSQVIGEEKAEERAGILYSLDNVNDIRFSHENPTVIELYENFLDAPLSEKSHHYLHTEVKDWDLEMNFDPDALLDPRQTY